jgi:Ca2+-binding EF-hand superfamily protein
LGGQKPPSFNQIDADNDGTISLEEFKAAAKMLPVAADSAESDKLAKRFAKIDTDGDGAISKEEASAIGLRISARIQAMMLEIQERHGAAGATTADAGVTPPSADDFFAKLDADGNGSISKDEFTAALDRKPHAEAWSDWAAKLFGKVDTDGDGSISKDENVAFVDQMHARHQRRLAVQSRLASQAYADASTAASGQGDGSAGTTESQTV